jgi:guanylate kinase
MATKVLGNHKRGVAFVVSAPAGTGKTTLVNRLVDEFDCVVQSISYTTRKPRAGEVQGRDYQFVSEEEFKDRIAAGDFLEYVELYGCHYGTSKEWVLDQLEKGNHVVLVIDTQGAKSLRGRFPAVFIFISPPSMEELRRRLAQRRTESEDVIQRRLAWAKIEMEAGQAYDYILVNDDLDTAYQVLRSIFIAEEHRLRSKQWT